MKVEAKDEKVVSVKSCDRCGKDHEHMTFEPLANSEQMWAFCTETGQPVIASREKLG